MDVAVWYESASRVRLPPGLDVRLVRDAASPPPDRLLVHADDWLAFRLTDLHQSLTVVLVVEEAPEPERLFLVDAVARNRPDAIAEAIRTTASDLTDLVDAADDRLLAAWALGQAPLLPDVHGTQLLPADADRLGEAAFGELRLRSQLGRPVAHALEASLAPVAPTAPPPLIAAAVVLSLWRAGLHLRQRSALRSPADEPPPTLDGLSDALQDGGSLTAWVGSLDLRVTARPDGLRFQASVPLSVQLARGAETLWAGVAEDLTVPYALLAGDGVTLRVARAPGDHD